MPSFRSGQVVEIISERPGLQRVRVRLDDDDDPTRAVNYTGLVGTVSVGDEVVCNTTAVELGLGTGGWHAVHWNLSRRSFRSSSGGHVMKLRYTSLQTDVLAASEDKSPLHAAMQDEDLAGMPIVAAGLHSLVAAVCAGVRSEGTALRIAYVMTDGGALPYALSDLVHDLVQAGLVDLTVTSGQAFGGQYESVTVASGMLTARHAGADVAVVAMGPGVVGTGLSSATSAREVSHVLTEVAALGGVPLACLRVSEADARTRHRGLSHHSVAALAATPVLDPPVQVVVPAVDEAAEAGIRRDLSGSGHELVSVDPGTSLDILSDAGLRPTSMGRGVDDDPLFWLAGSAAGIHAARVALNWRQGSASSGPRSTW